MLLSDNKPADVFEDVLKENGVTDTIYARSKPTAGLPNSYIDIYENGATSSRMSKHGVLTGYLLVSINVKILSTGSPNTKKERMILSSFDSIFQDNSIVVKDNYTFELDSSRMVYTGSDVHKGYTTKMINIKYNKIK